MHGQIVQACPSVVLHVGSAHSAQFIIYTTHMLSKQAYLYARMCICTHLSVAAQIPRLAHLLETRHTTLAHISASSWTAVELRDWLVLGHHQTKRMQAQATITS